MSADMEKNYRIQISCIEHRLAGKHGIEKF